MNTATISDYAIIQEVTIKAPAERIFNALTNPAELLKWWRAEGKFQAVDVECDPRPGGKWRMRVSGGCGTDPSPIVSGRYEKVEPPHLLIYTWLREQENWPESTVRWDLEENNGLTTVRVTHSGLTSQSMRARNDGWPLILSLLHEYLDH